MFRDLLANLIEFIINGPGGNIASVVGLLVSIIGFLIAIHDIRNSKKAADQAREAVLKVRNDIRNTDIVSDLSAAISIMEEIKRLHRMGSWILLPDRYAALKKLLVSIKVTTKDFSEVHQTAIQNAIHQFNIIEKQVEKALASENNPSNVPKLNEIVSHQVDNLGEILNKRRAKIGEDYDRH